ncbi:acyl-CoA dehydrogenase family protein [Desulfobacterota bacterium AH_259_B03_O07]|nr:acyl-CoA dehydrogenase family protein [Desulfobacterota bacterium AH_259_B03_O07]
MGWIFREEHEIFRKSVRQFVENEVIPHTEEWEEKGEIPRSIWKRMGEIGFLGIEYPEEYGGAGADFIYTLVFMEEISRCGAMGFPISVSTHTDMASPYLNLGTEERRKKYLPQIIKGEKICAIAVSEPSGGSDVAGIHTYAVRDEDFYKLNGSKIFITNGVNADIYFVVARVGELNEEDRHKGISIFIVDKETSGLKIGRKLDKMGWLCSDTAELFFEGCRVPCKNLIGKEGEGFPVIMRNFQRERLVISIISVSASQKALEDAINYARERVAFERPLSKFQVIRHRIAEMVTQIEAARQLTYYVSWLFSQGKATDMKVSMTKLYTTEIANRIAYEVLQIYGGYGYMREFPVERFYRDARALTIGAGTSEIMKEIIAKRLEL